MISEKDKFEALTRIVSAICGNVKITNKKAMKAVMISVWEVLNEVLPTNSKTKS